MTEIHKFASLMESGGHLGSVDTRNEPVYINNDSINNINNNNSTPGCKWASIHQKLRKTTAEFVGTAILATFGFGAIAQLVLTPNTSSWATMAATWGLALTLAIYAVGGISGAHLNPAVTMTMSVFRGFSYFEVPLYWAAQTCGAFVGALIIYTLNEPAIRALESTSTIGVFVTGFQTPATSLVVAFFAEFLGTALLMFVILATSEGSGITPTDPRFQPVVVGLTLTAVGLGLGQQSGFALNPARDFGPRVFVAIAGWGWKEAFARQGWYFWVPLIAPFFGAFGGAFTHDLLAYPCKKGITPSL